MNVQNWLAVIASAVAFFLIGWVWYGPLFSKPWAAGMGMNMTDPDQAPKMKPEYLVMSFLFGLFLAIAMASILATAGVADMGTAVKTAFLLWAGLLATTSANNAVYDTRPWSVWAINTGYQLVGLIVMAVILTVWV